MRSACRVISEAVQTKPSGGLCVFASTRHDRRRDTPWIDRPSRVCALNTLVTWRSSPDTHREVFTRAEWWFEHRPSGLLQPPDPPV